MRRFRPTRATVFGQGLLRRLIQPSAADHQQAQTMALYAELKKQHARSPLSVPGNVERLAAAVVHRARAHRALPQMLVDTLTAAVRQLIACEAHLFELSPPAPQSSIAHGVAARTQLRQRLAFYADQDRLVAEWLDGLADAVAAVIARLPPLPEPDAGGMLLSAPLATLIGDPAHLVAELVAIALRHATDPLLDRHSTRPGATLAGLVTANLLRASHISYAAAQKAPERLRSPLADTDDAHTLVERYLAGTPLAALAMAPVPLAVTQDKRFEHQLLLSGTGYGKTQTIQHDIAAHLDRPPAQVPALVVIDSKRAMLDKIARLACFDPDRGTLAGRLIIIDPTDIDHPPALNIFAVNAARIATYGRAAQQQVLNSIIETFDYLFGALLDADMTQKQRLVFRYLARLMLAIPGANIHTLRQLLDPDTGNDLYAAYADTLSPAIRAFFDTEYLDKQYAGTRRQVLRRLWGVLENETLERMLAADANHVDLFDALNNRGAIVLVHTARDFLKDEKSSFLGRIFIALTLQAVFERAALPQYRRRPTFLYIDEASEYFGDTKIDGMLTQARQHACGVVLAHQYYHQATPALRASIAANTAIKQVGGVAFEDARALAPDMRCTPDFIARQTKTAQAATFAMHVRNLTPTAITRTVPFGTLEAQPKMSNAAYARLIAQNRARLSGGGAVPVPPGADPPPIHPVPLAIGKLRAGAQEYVTLPEHSLTLPAKLDTQAVGLCALHVLSLDRVRRHGAAFARFTLATGTGDTVAIERRIVDTVTVHPFGGKALHCPVVSLRFRIAHHDLTERFALAVNPVSEVLLGQPVLAGRFMVDSAAAFLLGTPKSTASPPATADDWRS
jgi:hypothetical protein